MGGPLLVAVAMLATPALAEDAAKAEDATKIIPDPATVVMPKLDFAETEADRADYDKYFYFHRTDTGFEEALADLRECDGMSQGLQSGLQYQQAPYPYAGTMAGAAGGILGNLLAEAIVGSAEKRKLRRVNMRRCMGYKGYARYGLQKDLWQEFHFEEGFSGEEESKRQTMLAQQAKVASGSKPVAGELGI
jgi:hypothetical protein